MNPPNMKTTIELTPEESFMLGQAMGLMMQAYTDLAEREGTPGARHMLAIVRSLADKLRADWQVAS